MRLHQLFKNVTPFWLTQVYPGLNSEVNAERVVDVGIRQNLGVSKKKLPHHQPPEIKH